MKDEIKTYLRENIENFFTSENGRVFDAPKLIESLKAKGITDTEEVREAARYVIDVGMNYAG